MASAVELTAAAWVPTGERTERACQTPNPWGPQSLGAQGRRPRAGAEAAGVTLLRKKGKHHGLPGAALQRVQGRRAPWQAA